MYECSTAHMRMTRIILEGGQFDPSVYECKIITYKPEEERIYLLSEEAEVTDFTLDGIYECSLDKTKEASVCSGMVVERYWNKLGRVLVFQIKNGFYKKLLN